MKAVSNKKSEIILFLCCCCLFILNVAGNEFKKTIKSCEKTSFNEVAAKLNKGGIHYSYQGTNALHRQIEATFSCLEKLSCNLIEDQKYENKVLDIFKITKQGYLRTGFNEITGVGKSSIAIEKNFYHNRTFIHHYPENGNGIIWQILADKPNTMDCLKYIPKNAVMAGVFDLQLTEIRKWSQNEYKKVDLLMKDFFSDIFKNKDINAKTDKLDKVSKVVEAAENFDIDAFLTSFDDRVLFFITLDEKTPKSIVIAEHAFVVPEAAVLLALKVKNKQAFQAFEKYFKNSHRTEEKDGSVKLTFDYFKNPFSYNPVIIQKGEFLLIASHPKIIRIFEDLQNGKRKSIAKSAEIKKLSRNIPSEANSLFYMSPTLMPILHRAFRENIKPIINNNNKKLKTKLLHILNAGMELVNIFTPLKEESFIFSTVNRQKNGIMFYSNSATPIENNSQLLNISSLNSGIISLFAGRNGHIRILFHDGKILTLKRNVKTCRDLIPVLQRKFKYPKRIYKYLLKTAERYDKL